MLESESCPGPVETSHDLIADHHDTVAVAEVAHPFQIAFRISDDAVRADDRFQEDGRHIVRAFVLDLFTEFLQVEGCQFLFGFKWKIVAVRRRIGKFHEAVRAADLSSKASGIPGSVGSCKRCAVVAVVAAEDFRAPRRDPCHLDRIFVRVSSGIREEHARHIPAGQLDQFLCQQRLHIGRITRCHEAHLCSLILDCLHDFRMLMADVRVHQ
ncbi:hypothetical protein SDC9_72043 [bioreactor metagenome]|uniref:Uncharacterized protein n=1 Tax=bioreactor metagenome TaxID=1076179 RepID=A0A644YBJ1_9ZZZZ